jgi:hypothetical protein
MSKSTWTGAVSSDWNDADNWSPAGIPDASSDVVITTGAPVASASIGTVDSITDSSSLYFDSAGTNTVATFLDNTGSLYVDHNRGEGGTTLNIGGTLSNSNHLLIGNTTLSASDKVTAAALDNTGQIYLTGSSANQALLDVSGTAGFGTAGVLSGYARLAGDSAIEFASGEITSVAAKAQLHLYGSDAFIEDSSALGSNSALTGLASIGTQAMFDLENGASVSTTGALVNDGTIRLDAGGGGSSLTVGGMLTNNRTLSIGYASLSASDKVTAASLDNLGIVELTGSAANQALLDVTGSAGFGTEGVLSGAVQLFGDSAIEFANGQITNLGGGLSLVGGRAFIEDSSALGSNSALTGLASIGQRAYLELENGASVTTTGALVNDGNVEFVGDSGSSLTAAGALTNVGNLTLSSTSDKVTAAALDNTGTIQLSGSGGNLDVTGSAGFGTEGVLSGAVQLIDSAIEFASGEITSVAQNAFVLLAGDNAFIEDSTALGSNSALTGLANVAGVLYLNDGASVSTTGALVNRGSVELGGGSNLTLAGGLTNGGDVFIGGVSLSASDDLTAASFVNSGTVELIGNGTKFAALTVSGATTNNGSISIANEHRGARRSGRRHGVLQPLDGQSSVRFERFGAAKD